MKHLLFVLFSLFAFNGFTCLNESGTNLKGEFGEIGYSSFRLFINPTREPDQDHIDERLASLKAELTASNKTNKDNIHTDIAVYMIYNGDYQAAIDYMHTNVIIKDSNYSFCSNIGVAHELVGNLDSALFWTKKGLELNPSSHKGSEWIHIKILEAEIAISQDENWLETHSIFDFPISNDSIPTDFPKNFDAREFVVTSGFQLKERSFFVREENQDPVFSQLILLQADAYAQEFETTKCFLVYALAATHDTTLLSVVNKRIAYLHKFNVVNGISDRKGIAGFNRILQSKGIISEQVLIPIIEEKPKKKKKVIKGLIYYLGGGFVLLFIGMIYFIRRKPKTP